MDKLAEIKDLKDNLNTINGLVIGEKNLRNTVGTGNRTSEQTKHLNLLREIKDFLEAEIAAIDKVLATTSFRKSTHKKQDKFLAAYEAVLQQIIICMLSDENLPEELRVKIKDSFAENIFGEGESPTTESLSQRFAATKDLEYEVSWKLRLARRGKLLAIAILIVAAILLVTLIMSTPVGWIGATPAAILIALMTVPAYFRMTHPVTQTAHLSFNGMPVAVETAVPSSPVLLLQPIIGLWMSRHFIARRSVSPTHEVAAREAQQTTVDLLVAQLNAKLESEYTNKNDEVYKKLSEIIDKAAAMHRTGASCKFDEARNSRVQKARIILQAVAQIVEGEMPSTVKDLLKKEVEINGKHHQLHQLINASRNPISDNTFAFWARSRASIMKQVTKGLTEDQQQLEITDRRRLSISDLAVSAG